MQHDVAEPHNFKIFYYYVDMDPSRLDKGQRISMTIYIIYSALSVPRFHTCIHVRGILYVCLRPCSSMRD